MVQRPVFQMLQFNWCIDLFAPSTDLLPIWQDFRRFACIYLGPPTWWLALSFPIPKPQCCWHLACHAYCRSAAVGSCCDNLDIPSLVEVQGGKHETRPHEDSSFGLYWQYQFTSISSCCLVKGNGADNQLVLQFVYLISRIHSVLIISILDI